MKKHDQRPRTHLPLTRETVKVLAEAQLRAGVVGAGPTHTICYVYCVSGPNGG